MRLVTPVSVLGRPLLANPVPAARAGTAPAGLSAAVRVIPQVVRPAVTTEAATAGAPAMIGPVAMTGPAVMIAPATGATVALRGARTSLGQPAAMRVDRTARMSLGQAAAPRVSRTRQTTRAPPVGARALIAVPVTRKRGRLAVPQIGREAIPAIARAMTPHAGLPVVSRVHGSAGRVVAMTRGPEATSPGGVIETRAAGSTVHAGAARPPDTQEARQIVRPAHTAPAGTIDRASDATTGIGPGAPTAGMTGVDATTGIGPGAPTAGMTAVDATTDLPPGQVILEPLPTDQRGPSGPRHRRGAAVRSGRAMSTGGMTGPIPPTTVGRADVATVRMVKGIGVLRTPTAGPPLVGMAPVGPPPGRARTETGDSKVVGMTADRVSAGRATVRGTAASPRRLALAATRESPSRAWVPT